MPKRFKVRDIIRLIESDGWYLVSVEGSHRQYKHPTKAGKVTIASHPSDDVHPKILASICRQAQIEPPR